MTAGTRLKKYLEIKRIKNIHAIVKRRADFGSADFLTKTGQEIAARRGGIQTRREFFMSVLAELEEYET